LCGRLRVPLFLQPRPGRPTATPPPPPARPEQPAIADARTLSLAPGRRLRTRLAGAFLFLPLLARLRLDRLAEQAGYPRSVMVPAPAALLSLLALKLLDKERRSHVNDCNFDEALGLFAGLNVLPKKSFWTEYSYRCDRSQQRALLAGWVAGLSGLLCEQAEAFSLDFHPMPTLLLSNNIPETTGNPIIRYAGRNRMEDGLGQCVNFFHLDCLASEVRLNVDPDAALTVLAQGC
jgi:hypothetical protein